jgi:hypothetical protein
MFNDPKFVLESVFIYSGADVISVLSHYLSSLDRLPALIFLVAVVFLLGAAWILCGRTSDIRLLGMMTLFACFAFLVSLLPNWLIVSNVETMSDQYTMLLVGAMSALLLGLTVAFRIGRRLLPSFMASDAT